MRDRFFDVMFGNCLHANNTDKSHIVQVFQWACHLEPNEVISGAREPIYNLNRIIRLQAVLEIITNETARALDLLADQATQMQTAIFQHRMVLDYLLAGEGGVCEVQVKLSEKGIGQIYPQGDLQKAEETAESPRTPPAPPPMYPLVKMEYLYEDDNDRPHIITKEVPFTSTELAKLRKDFARTAKELEYVWRVSLSGGVGILLSEKEVEGYWGLGVFLTTGNHWAPWSLTQRGAYWARGLNTLERGDPLAITGAVDQLEESVQKTACLQMMYDQELKPNQGSPMMTLVDPERMTPLIRGLPDSLKPIGIQLQGKIQNTPEGERVTAALEAIMTPDQRRSGRKVWMWGEVAQELINFGRKYGPVGGSSQRTETKVAQAAEQVNGQQPSLRKGQDLGCSKAITP
ncbi:LOW QUALITY PROTEIN: uncharacterized protein LOC141917848 [Strix aluco]|uniref:LOW QUALITY PROTEIN: uncharacterized protein LOC141917848 n=1 Tax=Strix aluco TaxID=111821 RepID=UPI003DA522A1